MHRFTAVAITLSFVLACGGSVSDAERRAVCDRLRLAGGDGATCEVVPGPTIVVGGVVLTVGRVERFAGPFQDVAGDQVGQALQVEVEFYNPAATDVEPLINVALLDTEQQVSFNTSANERPALDRAKGRGFVETSQLATLAPGQRVRTLWVFPVRRTRERGTLKISRREATDTAGRGRQTRLVETVLIPVPPVR